MLKQNTIRSCGGGQTSIPGTFHTRILKSRDKPRHIKEYRQKPTHFLKECTS